MNKLDELALKYGTDKSSKWHNYTARYYREFKHLCDKEIRILEIGVYEGASLRTWEEFFPKAKIFAIDSYIACTRYASERSSIFIGDQADPIFLNSVVKQTGGNWDLILDDGGHTMVQQITSFKKLFPHLNSGGIYVIEDLHTSYNATYGGGLRKAGTTMEYLKDLLDEMNVGDKFCGDPNKVFDKEWIDSIHFYLALAFIFKIVK